MGREKKVTRVGAFLRGTNMSKCLAQSALKTVSHVECREKKGKWPLDKRMEGKGRGGEGSGRERGRGTEKREKKRGPRKTKGRGTRRSDDYYVTEECPVTEPPGNVPFSLNASRQCDAN